MFFFFFSSRRRHTRSLCDWSSDVCSSDLGQVSQARGPGDVADISEPIATMQGEIARLAASIEQDIPDRLAREIDGLAQRLDTTARTGADADADVIAAMRDQLAELS